MLQNPICIKVTSIIALILFVLVLVIGIALTSTFLLGVEYFSTPENYMYESVSPDDPGAGWYILFQTLGGTAAGFISAVAAAMGIACIIGNIIIYIPALIAWIVYKVSKNTTAYWILMAVWLTFWAIAIVLLIFG